MSELAAKQSEWSLTNHAREQMLARNVSAVQLERVLRAPQHSTPDPKGRAHCRYYVADGVLAVVDVEAREVITVGLDGASALDWRDHVSDDQHELDSFESSNVVTSMSSYTRPRVQQARARVHSSSVLDGVHPRIADAVREQVIAHGVDFRSVVVQSPTCVLIELST